MYLIIPATLGDRNCWLIFTDGETEVRKISFLPAFSLPPVSPLVCPSSAHIVPFCLSFLLFCLLNKYLLSISMCQAWC